MAAGVDEKIFKKLESEWKSQIGSNPNYKLVLECPVCKEVANPPVFACLAGHIICEKCHNPKVSDCPKCNSIISTTKCEFAEKFMKTIKLHCNYEEDGCKRTLKANEFRHHIQQCPNRPIECFLTKCGQHIPYTKFFKHLTTVHSQKVNGIENVNKHIIEWWIEGDPTKAARWPPFYLTCFGNAFLYMAISTAHGSWEWAWIIASEEEAERFRLRTTINNKDKKVALQWTGAVHSIRKSIRDIMASGIVFVTNTKEMQNPYLFLKNEEQSKHFWRTEVEIQEIKPPPPGFVPYISTKDEDLVTVSPGESEFESIFSGRNTRNQSVFNIQATEPESKSLTKTKKSVPYSEPLSDIGLPGDIDKVGSVSGIKHISPKISALPGDIDKVGSVRAIKHIIPELPPPPVSTQKSSTKSEKSVKIVSIRDSKSNDNITMKIEMTKSKGGVQIESKTLEIITEAKYSMDPSEGEKGNIKIVKTDSKKNQNPTTEVIYANSKPIASKNSLPSDPTKVELSQEPLVIVQIGQGSNVEVEKKQSVPKSSKSDSDKSKKSRSRKAVGSSSDLPYFQEDTE